MVKKNVIHILGEGQREKDFTETISGCYPFTCKGSDDCGMLTEIHLEGLKLMVYVDSVKKSTVKKVAHFNSLLNSHTLIHYWILVLRI